MFTADAAFNQPRSLATDAAKSTIEIVREALEARLEAAELLLQEVETLPAGTHREEAINRIQRRILYAHQELGKLG